MDFKKVKSIRTVASMQIGPHGSTLDEQRTDCTLTLRPDLGGVLACGRFCGTDYNEYLVPMGLIAHIKLYPEHEVPGSKLPAHTTATGKLVVPTPPEVPAAPPPVVAAPEPAPVLAADPKVAPVTSADPKLAKFRR